MPAEFYTEVILKAAKHRGQLTRHKDNAIRQELYTFEIPTPALSRGLNTRSRARVPQGRRPPTGIPAAPPG